MTAEMILAALALALKIDGKEVVNVERMSVSEMRGGELPSAV